MKHGVILKLTINIIIAICLYAVATAKEVLPGDSALWVTGANYTQITADGMEFLRFSTDVLSLSNSAAGFNTEKARTTSCATLNFTTDSDEVQLRFKFNAGDHIRNGDFIVNQNSQYFATFHYTVNDATVVIDLQSTNPGNPVDYSVVMPTFANPILTGITIDESSTMQQVVLPAKNVYVAFGDSITHGVGQDNSTQTYAYQLAEMFDMELFNMAVGGGKISVPAAESLIDFSDVDLITILIGYNGLHFAQKTPEQYRSDYNAMLDAIRTNHPVAKLFCITLLYTTNNTDDVTGYTADQFRAVVEDIVAERIDNGDENIFLIAGDEITSQANLRDNDKVHLSIEGAAMFADDLYKEINLAWATCNYPVDFHDFAMIASNWLLNGNDFPGDMNKDGHINAIDLNILASYWLSDCSQQ